MDPLLAKTPSGWRITHGAGRLFEIAKRDRCLAALGRLKRGIGTDADRDLFVRLANEAKVE